MLNESCSRMLSTFYAVLLFLSMSSIIRECRQLEMIWKIWLLPYLIYSVTMGRCCKEWAVENVATHTHSHKQLTG